MGSRLKIHCEFMNVVFAVSTIVNLFVRQVVNGDLDAVFENYEQFAVLLDPADVVYLVNSRFDIATKRFSF